MRTGSGDAGLDTKELAGASTLAYGKVRVSKTRGGRKAVHEGFHASDSSEIFKESDESDTELGHRERRHFLEEKNVEVSQARGDSENDFQNRTVVEDLAMGATKFGGHRYSMKGRGLFTRGWVEILWHGSDA